MYPFPNNFWLRPVNGDTTTLRTNFSDATFPLTNAGHPVRAGYGGWNGRDGFSPMGPITFYLPNATLSGAPRLWNVSTSKQLTATVLLDTATGALVPHWVELDHMSDPDQTQRTAIMWPSTRLVSGRRYVVAAHGLVDGAGAAVPPSAAFAALRDKQPSSDPAVTARRTLFDDIFNLLAKVGVDRADVQIAWDFTVASQKQLTGTMVSMRDDGLPRLGSAPHFTIDKITDNVTASSIFREVQGSYLVPWYLNKPGIIPGFDSRIVRDAAGNPVFQSMQPMNFTVRIPYVATMPGHAKASIVQYGHGLFGDQSEVRSGYLGDESQQHNYVMGAVDWIGLSQYDEATVALMLADDVSNFAMVPERCHQGMLNALAFMRVMMSDAFANHPAMTFHGVPAYDTTKRFYYGNSQGGILGTVYMALSQDVTKGCIGVGGGPYGLLLPRSADFSALEAVLDLRYKNDLSRAALYPMFQVLWDTLEPSGYIDAISSTLLPNTPAHRVIFHYGLGDAQVTWLGGLMISRSADAVMFESNVHEGNETLALFPKVADDAVISSGNVVMGFTFGAPVAPFINHPAQKSTDAHEKPRRTPEAQLQMYEFFSTGMVRNTCGGACVYNSTQA